MNWRKKAMFAGFAASPFNGAKPVGTPLRSVRYVPPHARTKISAPRSLSKNTCFAPVFSSCACRKFCRTVLPPPVGPMIRVWPTSARWKLNQKDEPARVFRSVTASPQ